MRRFENAHIALWLLKDTCWVMLWKVPALIMAGPTLALAVYITVGMWHQSATERVHNLAVCAWIGANVTWMYGEFFHEDNLRPAAAVFFFTGLSILLIFYAMEAVVWVRGRML